MDLLALAGQDTGAPFRKAANTNGGEHVGPCPLCRAGDDRFHVWPDHPSGKARWWCRHCDKNGDLADYLQQVRGWGVKESLEEAGVADSPLPGRSPQPEQPKPPASPWQERAREFTQYAQKQLWAESGLKAREYLHTERGLKGETIRHFGLGYNPKAVYDRPVEKWGLSEGKSVYLSQGIVIPCQANGMLWYVQVRRPTASDAGKQDSLAARLGNVVEFRPAVKYWSVKGNQGTALFGADGLPGDGKPLLLCEGEFDAMLAWQELRDKVDVATFGGASKGNSGIPARWLLRLLPYTLILAAYDVDANGAGDKGAAALARRSRRVRRIRVPKGSDLTDFWRQGGDLRAWLESSLSRQLEAAVAPLAA